MIPSAQNFMQALNFSKNMGQTIIPHYLMCSRVENGELVVSLCTGTKERSTDGVFDDEVVKRTV